MVTLWFRIVQSFAGRKFPQFHQHQPDLMKLLRLLVLSVSFVVTLHANYVPTPDMAMSFAMDKDPTKWVAQFMDGSKKGIIFELVPQGESIESWNEMVAQQIAFTKASLRKHVDEWKAMLVRADPAIEMKEEKKEDESIVAEYTSLAAKETSVRRFIKAKDGIYMLAYHVRPARKEEARLQIWREIVAGASLIPNPEKKRR